MNQGLVYELKSVSLTLKDTRVLEDLNLRVNWQERVAIIGPSGAGKSSLLRLLNGALKPSDGQLKILGQSVQGLSRRQLRLIQRQIGTIYQQFNLVNDLRVIHNVNAGNLGRWPVWKALWSLLYPLNIDEARRALEQVGIAEKLFIPTAQLSGGQQQRVAIARVLIQNPLVVLADEPVSSLDPRLSQDMIELLLSLLGQQPRTVITSLHDVALAKHYYDRIVGLRSGRILFDLPAIAVTTEKLAELYDQDSGITHQSLAARSLPHPHG
ncbi:MAG: phosphonate ABC transporter ATP-binding protein [Cyanobacteria bacterium P01_F01_bin.42]